VGWNKINYKRHVLSLCVFIFVKNKEIYSVIKRGFSLFTEAALGMEAASFLLPLVRLRCFGAIKR
jgi:hypothetical protein